MPNAPPPRNYDIDKGPDDWTPYENCLQFEVADFLFCRNQMSAGDINYILRLWAGYVAVDKEPPFKNAASMYKVINSTPLAGTAWESFSLQYNGDQAAGDVLSWMNTEFDVWFQDPCTLVHNLLSNPDFKAVFDYAPFQEHTSHGVHRFQDFMSANWAWKQAVSCCNMS